MRALIYLMLMGSLIAQKSVQDNQQFPQPIIPFELILSSNTVSTLYCEYKSVPVKEEVEEKYLPISLK